MNYATLDTDTESVHSIPRDDVIRKIFLMLKIVDP